MNVVKTNQSSTSIEKVYFKMEKENVVLSVLISITFNLTHLEGRYKDIVMNVVNNTRFVILKLQEKTKFRRKEIKKIARANCKTRLSKIDVITKKTYDFLIFHLTNLGKALISEDEAVVLYLCKSILDFLEAVLLTLTQYRKKRCWVMPMKKTRENFGEFHSLFRDMKTFGREDFFVAVRMTPERFEYLLAKVGPIIQRQNTTFRCSISAAEQLAVTLRYLAHGESQPILAVTFRLGRSTVCNIIHRTLKAIWNQLQPEYLPIPTITNWKKYADEFFFKWQFPNCAGAIDGKHIKIATPPNSGSTFFNYKSFPSIVLMAVCSADYKFTVVNIGASGQESDGGIFSRSQFGKQLLDGSLPLPNPAPLPNSDIVMPYVLVGDEAFPLAKHIMRPYPGSRLTYEKSVFNYRLSRARRVIENTFGILTTRWRIFHQTIFANVKTAESIVMATVCLHNFLKVMDKQESNIDLLYCPATYVDREDDFGNMQNGNWRHEINNNGALADITSFRRNCSARLAQQNRDALANYFCSSAGEVEWQFRVVNRGK